jgi:hypothetical protein
MTDITQISTEMQDILGEKANQIAHQTSFVRREVKVSGSNFAQTLVFGFLDNPKMSYREMRQTARYSGLDISAQGLEQKFSQSSAYFMQALLEKVVQQVVCASAIDIELLNRFPAIRIQDGSVIGLPEECVDVWQGIYPKGTPGCSALKLHVGLEYKSGKLSGPTLANGREHDKKSPWFCQPLQKGELRLADLGFFDLDQLASDAQTGGFWITRYRHDACLYQKNVEIALLPFLQAQSLLQVDVPVSLGKDHRLPCRLIAFRATDQVVEKRKRKLHRYASQKGVTVSQERLQLAHWTLFLTNAPQDLLSALEVFALYRLRWQIELLFRLWKTYSFIDECNSHNHWRVLTELYAKLIAVVIQHWLLLASVWQRPNKSVVQACSTIRKFAMLLQLNFSNTTAFSEVIATMVAVLQATPSLLQRKKNPSTFQVLSNPDLALC